MLFRTMNSSNDPLDELLERCRAAPEPPPQIPTRVARLIAESHALAPPSWMERLDAVCARPSFASAFVAACVLLGLFLAEARLTRIHAAQGAQMARSYLQLIDPLLDAPRAQSPAPRTP
jgi:hypothetical protein